MDIEEFKYMSCCGDKEVGQGDLVSVVLPVFNTEEYLPACLDSLLRQTYPNLEIVVVDDGSYDGSSVICDQYARSNECISVHHIDNHGLSYARNFGISVSRGLYATFVDSDDVVPAYYIEYLMNGLINNSADLSCVQRKEIESQDAISSFPRETDLPAFNLTDTKTALSKMLQDTDISVSACAKMAETSFWRRHEFPVGRVYEDLATCAEIISDAQRVAFSSAEIYGQVYRAGSLSRKATISNKQYGDWSFALNQSVRVLKNSGYYEALEDEIECFMMLNSIRLIHLFEDVAEPDGNSLSIWNEAKDYVTLHLRSIGKNRLAGRSLRIKSLLVSKAPQLYSAAFSAYQRLKLTRR